MERVQQDAHCKEGTDAFFFLALNFYGEGNANSLFSLYHYFDLCYVQIIKDGEEHADLNEVAKLFNIHED